MKLVTTEEMRCAEQAAVEAGDTWEGLMERAGRSVAQEVLSRLPDPREGRRILVLVGPGNNGGDGLVAGCFLREGNLPVAAYLWKRQDWEDDPLVQALVQQDGQVMCAEDDEDLVLLDQELAAADVVIDGLLGMGLTRELEGQLSAIVERVNAARRPLVVAVDLPTGVHADTGEVLGLAIRADVTVTMSQAKRGLYQFPGAGYAGERVVVDIGIPAKMVSEVAVELLEEEGLRALLPPRPLDAHKGTFGRVLVIAGSLHYVGAPYLAAMGAGRVGAGLVTLALPRTLYSILAGRAVEATFLPLPEAETGAIGEGSVQILADVLSRYQAVVLGCGLGQDEGTIAFVRRFLGMREQVRSGIGFLPRLDARPVTWDLPALVLDADGLNALADVPEWWQSLPAGRVVLTPHPGEMARLLGVRQKEVLASRIAVARQSATTWKQVVVFKGAHTVVAGPDGHVVVSPIASPALATAGTGDVLAGVIGGFLAQGLDSFDAAVLGVHMHGLAGVMVQETLGNAGVLAGDLLDRLPLVCRQLRGGQ